MMEQPDVTIMKLLTQKIQRIPNQHPCEDRNDINADQDVIRFDSRECPVYRQNLQNSSNGAGSYTDVVPVD